MGRGKKSRADHDTGEPSEMFNENVSDTEKNCRVVITKIKMALLDETTFST